jgi:predicted small secreted protein
MRPKSTSLLIVVVLLVTASLACDTITGGGIKNLQSTANAVLTQGASAGGTAQATVSAALTQGAGAGDAAQATANAALTQAAGGSNPAATAPPGSTNPTATAAATSATTGGGPSDIPFIDATNTILLTSDKLVTYDTSADIPTAVKFYKDQMPKNGWTFDATTSVETPAATVLNFTKDTRKATVTISTDPRNNQTLVAIILS